nr:hypothetical protein [uncultured Aquabacterium sp.]
MAEENLFYIATSWARSQVMLYTDDRNFPHKAMGQIDYMEAEIKFRRRDSALCVKLPFASRRLA